MKKNLLTLLFLCSISYGLIAQTSFGIKGGFNLADFSQNYADPNDESDTKYLPTFNLGFTIDIPISEQFYFSSGVNYSRKGTNLDLNADVSPDISITGYDKIHLNYLLIPLTGKLSVGPIKITAGPYIAFGINAYEKYNYTISFLGFEETFVGTDEIKFTNEYDPNFDYGQVKNKDFGAIIGVEYPFGPLSLGLNYEKGFTNLSLPNPNDSTYDPKDFKTTNTVLSINVTYLIKK